jgi:putative holliday junction resolvase
MRDLAGRAPFLSVPTFSPSSMTDRVVLGFDFGTRRIGVAIANTITRQARPLATIGDRTIEARWSAIAALVHDWQPAQLVVGIPRHPDDAPHAMTARAERFARQLQGRYRLPVARVDERYSSAAAAGNDDLDAAAAAVILQQWLESGEGIDA